MTFPEELTVTESDLYTAAEHSTLFAYGTLPGAACILVKTSDAPRFLQRLPFTRHSMQVQTVFVPSRRAFLETVKFLHLLPDFYPEIPSSRKASSFRSYFDMEHTMIHTQLFFSFFPCRQVAGAFHFRERPALPAEQNAVVTAAYLRRLLHLPYDDEGSVLPLTAPYLSPVT
ncbi:hypothetical protein [Alkalicoccus urumqiensis]|nr:hypothetical protein [Alkalicoccus urumqiensis]